MEHSHILSVAIPRPLNGLFTYKVPESLLSRLEVGGWVKVPFGRTVTYAFVVEPPKPVSEIPKGLSADSLKEILEVGEKGPIFPPDVLELCHWAHEYYRAPLGEVLHCAAPPTAFGLKKSQKREPKPLSKTISKKDSTPLQLTLEQLSALQILEKIREEKKAALLHGVTGSGKTELYLELARRTLSAGKGVLLLVPEIALTSQLHRRFEEGLGVYVGLWHSAMAEGKRRAELEALRKGGLRVIVGARSAVFAPVPNLGLIVIDEEHDPSYKQEDRVRYHARDLAVVRSKQSGAFIVLGSATPSIETRERVKEGRYGIACLTQRISAGGLPSIEVVDLRQEDRVENIQAPLAKKTLQAIRETLAQNQQVMIYLNRRGFASFLICEDCGDVRGCPHCSISLTLHRQFLRLRCHSCSYSEQVPQICPKCHGSNLIPVGAGTESLEIELPHLIEGVRPLRLDRDQVTSVSRLEKTLEEFRSGKANVLLGTQMLVKGHDFPGVTLVVVILADALFRWPDFRAPERAYQVLTQVAGRAGRGNQPGRVMIQSFDVEHPAIQALQGKLPEEEFIDTERELRKALGYPPFGRMARIRFENENRDEAQARARCVAQSLTSLSQLELLGPSEAFVEKIRGIYRWDLLIKTPYVQALQRGILQVQEICSKQKWPFLVDVDPNGVG